MIWTLFLLSADLSLQTELVLVAENQAGLLCLIAWLDCMCLCLPYRGARLGREKPGCKGTAEAVGGQFGVEQWGEGEARVMGKISPGCLSGIRVNLQLNFSQVAVFSVLQKLSWRPLHLQVPEWG